MAVQQISPPASISLFTASKQIRFLESLKRLQFSGELVLTDPNGQKWIFYLYQGQIMYATGGTHPVRRWQRNLAAYCPQMPVNRSLWQRELASIPASALKTCWQYQLLCSWVAQQKIPGEQADNMIRAVVTEVLFDIAQARRATYQIKQDHSLSTQLVLIDVEQAIAQVEQLWEIWHKDAVADYSPNLTPVISQPEALRQRTSPPIFQTLTKVLDGQHTLRDLAMLMKRDVLQVTRSLLPYIQLGLVELIRIPDLPAPVDPPVPETPVTATPPKARVVACVDDSPLVCQTMESLLTAAGYQYVGVQDGLRAIALMLARKPDAIFLDLVMPNTNGYEICAQLRKLPQFQNTPILILTGNDGIVDRVRAKLVGASDFLNKPVDAGVVLTVLRKHLEQGATSH